MVIGGVEITLGDVVDLIILIGALCAAIYKIWDFFAKPTSKIKSRAKQKRREEIIAVLDDVLPEKLKQHDLETRDRYKADRERYLQDIKNEVLKAIGGSVTKNEEDLEALKISARDVLREKIMAIYHKNRADRTMTEYEREALDQYYKDYHALKGNSYIDKRMGRMDKWQVIYDENPDDEE